MLRRSGVDPYLAHVPDPKPTATAQALSTARVLRGGTTDASDWVPALVRIPKPDFALPHGVLKGFKESARLGNVLTGRGTKLALQELGGLPGVTVEVSREGGSWELEVSMQTVRGIDIDAPAGDAIESQCLIAIIDGGIDPRHRAFDGPDGKTRIKLVWDQAATGGNPPRRFGFNYGTLHTGAQIDDARARGQSSAVAAHATEMDLRHGTHVASIAAGRRTLGPDGQPTFAGGMAPDMPLIVVIPALRAVPDKRPSEGFAKSHVDALSFIDRVAEELDLPVVVNVSAGIAAGAHDGSSTLEAGFDAFMRGGHARGRAVVKSAGNAHDADRYRRFNLAKHQDIDVRLRPSPVEAGPATIEVWFSSAHQVQLTLTEGDRAEGFVLSLRQPQGALETQQGTAGLTYERFHRDNGDSLILLSLPPTEQGFCLRFSGVAIRGANAMDLWIEGPLRVDRATEVGTLTMPGSARSVVTVASSNRAGNVIATTSSKGPTRDGRMKPELYAPGDQIRAAAAGTELDTLVCSGTSMAAPHVTGALALCLSKQRRLDREIPNALQLRAALIATASFMDGNWQQDRGYGLLNARALLNAFDDPTEAEKATAE